MGSGLSNSFYINNLALIFTQISALNAIFMGVKSRLRDLWWGFPLEIFLGSLTRKIRTSRKGNFLTVFS